jgi:hypothetical protein
VRAAEISGLSRFLAAAGGPYCTDYCRPSSYDVGLFVSGMGVRPGGEESVLEYLDNFARG